MANLKNLKPFQKGHKKLGGRKKGVPKSQFSTSYLSPPPTEWVVTAEALAASLGISVHLYKTIGTL